MLQASFLSKAYEQVHELVSFRIGEEQKQGSEQVLQAIGQVSNITQRVKDDAQQMVKRQQTVTNH